MHALLRCAETGPYSMGQTSQSTLLYMTATFCAWNMQQQPKCWKRGGLCTRSATLWGIQATDTIHDTIHPLYALHKSRDMKRKEKRGVNFPYRELSKRGWSYNVFHIILFLFFTALMFLSKTGHYTVFFMTIPSLTFEINRSFFLFLIFFLLASWLCSFNQCWTLITGLTLELSCPYNI